MFKCDKRGNTSTYHHKIKSILQKKVCRKREYRHVLKNLEWHGIHNTCDQVNVELCIIALLINITTDDFNCYLNELENIN